MKLRKGKGEGPPDTLRPEKEGKNVVAIDGSLLAFRAAAAGEVRSIVATHIKSKKSKAFANRTAFKAWLVEKNAEKKTPWEAIDFTIEDIQTAPPEKVCFGNAKNIINYIVQACDADEVEIYLDEDGDTFRHGFATVQKYKGTRDGKTKPTNLAAVKEYLVIHQGAQYPPRMKVTTDDKEILEVDDYINILKYNGWKANMEGGKDKLISVSFDKDDLGNSGWSFDFRRKDGVPLMRYPIWIDGLGELTFREKQKDCKGAGRKFFYYQWVDQDTADNYKARKLSKKKWSSKKCFELLGPLETDKECLQAVASMFKEWYPEPTEYVSWDGFDCVADWVDLAQEYFDLARMLRWEGDTVSVEKLFKRAKVDVTEGRRDESAK